MRVIFLSSAYFGYVHTYAFDPNTTYDLTGDLAVQDECREHEPAVGEWGRPLKERVAVLFKQQPEQKSRPLEETSC